MGDSSGEEGEVQIPSVPQRSAPPPAQPAPPFRPPPQHQLGAPLTVPYSSTSTGFNTTVRPSLQHQRPPPPPQQQQALFSQESLKDAKQSIITSTKTTTKKERMFFLSYFESGLYEYVTNK